MLIICCGMMRSGSTLQYQLTVEILEKTGKGKGCGEIRNSNCQELLEKDSSTSMQVFKVHQFRHLKGVKKAIADKQAKGIYIYRDIRDVTVSLMKMRKATFERLIFETGEIKECIRDFYNWTNLDNMLISRYESMVNNLPQEVLKIAEHLNIDISQEDAQEIADHYSIEQQKKRIKQWKNNQVNENLYDPKSLLHGNHISSGQHNQWNKILTPIQVAYLESISKDWLSLVNYPLTQPLTMQWLSQLTYSKYSIERKLNNLKKV
ncbi:MAG: sulfotransferase domain-containing protein [Crocosphaera sp.]|nr:sulfotransferase domain-containing protein [Crocosphaera sp.]